MYTFEFTYLKFNIQSVVSVHSKLRQGSDVTCANKVNHVFIYRSNDVMTAFEQCDVSRCTTALKENISIYFARYLIYL